MAYGQTQTEAGSYVLAKVASRLVKLNRARAEALGACRRARGGAGQEFTVTQTLARRSSCLRAVAGSATELAARLRISPCPCHDTSQARTANDSCVSLRLLLRQRTPDANCVAVRRPRSKTAPYAS